MITFVLVGVLLILYALGSSVPGLAGARLGDELKRQFGPFEHLEARVVTDPPIRATVGQIDQLRVLANGFTVEGLPIATASLETAPFALAPWSVLTGHPRLERPLEATAGVVLSEDALNALLHAPRITSHLRGIPAQFSFLPGMPAIERRVDVFPGRLRVHAGALSVVGTLDFGGGVLVPFAATASPRLTAPNQLVMEGLQVNVMGSALPPSLLARALKPLDLTSLAAINGSASVSVSELAFVPGQVRLGAQVTLMQLAP